MGKFYGAIGYAAETVETKPGVWEQQITERNYTGDVFRSVSKWRNGENLNPNVTLDNRISFIADPFAHANYHEIRYVELRGVKWQVTSIEVEPPRLVLTIGEVYNGK